MTSDINNLYIKVSININPAGYSVIINVSSTKVFCFVAFIAK
jgi:hypothetical protein